MITKVFSADNNVLYDVLGFAEEELEKAGCPMPVMMKISVSLEEIFVNVASYAYPENTGDVEIGMDVKDNAVTFTIKDSGLKFNPLAKEDPDITLSAEERDVGGLGIYMTKKFMDYMDYSYENGQNVLTLRKNF